MNALAVSLVACGHPESGPQLSRFGPGLVSKVVFLFSLSLFFIFFWIFFVWVSLGLFMQCVYVCFDSLPGSGFICSTTRCSFRLSFWLGVCVWGGGVQGVSGSDGVVHVRRQSERHVERVDCVSAARARDRSGQGQKTTGVYFFSHVYHTTPIRRRQKYKRNTET